MNETKRHSTDSSGEEAAGRIEVRRHPGGAAESGPGAGHRLRLHRLSVLVTLLFLTTPAFSQQGTAAAPTNGLVGYWRLDDGSGSSAVDSSGHGNTGTLSNGPQWIPGVAGASALNFPAHGLLRIPNSPSLSPDSAMTVTFWARQSAVANGGIIGKWDYPNHEQSWLVRARSDGAIRVNIAPTPDDPLYSTAAETPSGSWTAGAWHHVAFVFDGDQSPANRLRVYLDDAARPLSLQGSMPASLANASAALTAGMVPDADPWNGAIDDVRIYARALSAQEIDAIYRDAGGVTTPPPPPLPQIVSFTASPATILPGQSSVLSWTISSATSASLDNGLGPQSAVSAGSLSVSPAVTTTYTLTAANGSKTDTATATVTVAPSTGGSGGLSVSVSPNSSRPGRYDIYELTLSHPRTYPNPWEDVAITANFTSPSGRTYTIGGFYYGPNTWKVRFAPAETGSYTWTLGMNTPAGSYSTSGSFVSAASSNTGFLRLYGPSAPYQFKTEGNQKAFYPLAIQQGYDGPKVPLLQFFLPPVTGEIYPVTPDTYFGTYTASGFNFFRSNGQSANYIATFNNGGANTYDPARANLIDALAASIRKYDWKLMFAPIACPNKYVPAFDAAGNPGAAQALRNAYQYAINRWAAYTDIWELMNENGCPSVSTVPPAYYQWITTYLRANDPYGHPITTSFQPNSPQPNIEIAAPHYFIKGSYNPSLTLDDDVLNPVRSARNFLPGQPVIFGEIGNDCPVPDSDPPMNERYRIMLWTTFFNQSYIVPWNSVHGDGVACQAGSPSNLYVGSIQRAQAAVFSGYVADFDPFAKPIRLTLSVSAGGTVRGYGLGSGSDIGAYIIHTNSHTTPVTATVGLTVPQDGMQGSWIEPATGKVLKTFVANSGPQTLDIPVFDNDIVLRIRAAGTAPAPNGQPRIAAIRNAASYSDGKAAPGEMVLIAGSGLGPAALVSGTADPDTGVLPSSLAGTRVLFDGAPAPLIFVSESQAGAVVPFGLAATPLTQVEVEYGGARSAPVPLEMAGAAPGLFAADASGRGQGAILNQDGTLNSAANPAAPGSVITLYGTGAGETSPPGEDGRIVSNAIASAPLLPVTISIGGAPAPDVFYSGAAPSEVAGKFRIDVRVPPETLPGDQAVVVTIGESSSQPGLTAAIR